MLTMVAWILLGITLWIGLGLIFAWLFGQACRLGGPDDPRLPRCQHDTSLDFYCYICDGPTPQSDRPTSEYGARARSA